MGCPLLRKTLGFDVVVGTAKTGAGLAGRAGTAGTAGTMGTTGAVGEDASTMTGTGAGLAGRTEIASSLGAGGFPTSCVDVGLVG